eukprot:4271390-Pyramimonas_sp.AAC.1
MDVAARQHGHLAPPDDQGEVASLLGEGKHVGPRLCFQELHSLAQAVLILRLRPYHHLLAVGEQPNVIYTIGWRSSLAVALGNDEALNPVVDRPVQ